MTCSNRNLLVNGEFKNGLSPWVGSGIKHVKSPINPNDAAVWMPGPGSYLHQVVKGAFETRCAYYLYFRVLNAGAKGKPTQITATVSYLNAGGRLLRSTPVSIKPPAALSRKWFAYYTIVPPPPPETRFVVVNLRINEGALFVDSLRLASHEVKVQDHEGAIAEPGSPF
jgi:hypothetical protein